MEPPMKRPGTPRKPSALMAFGLLLALSGNASAAILSFGCLGRLGDQRIVFNRDGLLVVNAKTPAGKPTTFTADTVGDAISAIKQGKDSYTEFGPDSVDGLDETPIQFSLIDAEKNTHKVVFTQTASKRVSHRHRMICGRDEDTDLFRNIYRYERDSEPARDIKMQCFYYQLSTRGGRKGCDGD
jgi:hypothetical protein